MTRAPFHPRARPSGRGVNHLALVTADMDATVRFYVGVLGARLVATVGTPRSATTSSTSARARRSRSSSTATSSVESTPSRRASRARGGAVRPPLVRPRRRRGAARPAGPAQAAQLRGHRRRRPRLHPVDLLHRPERHRARGVVLGARPDRSRRRLDSTTSGCSATPIRCRRSPSSRAGALQHVPATKLVDGFTKQAEDWVVR